MLEAESRAAPRRKEAPLATAASIIFVVTSAGFTCFRVSGFRVWGFGVLGFWGLMFLPAFTEVFLGIGAVFGQGSAEMIAGSNVMGMHRHVVGMDESVLFGEPCQSISRSRRVTSIYKSSKYKVSERNHPGFASAQGPCFSCQFCTCTSFQARALEVAEQAASRETFQDTTQHLS